MTIIIVFIINQENKNIIRHNNLMIEKINKISILLHMIGLNTIKKDCLFKMTFKIDKFLKKKDLTMI